MTYIAWYNTKYERQFEVTVSPKVWENHKAKFGTAGAAAILVSSYHRTGGRKKATAKSERSASMFVFGSFTRPDIFGTPIVKIGKDKKAVLDMGRSELVLTSIGRNIHVRRPNRKRRTRNYPR